MKSVYTFGPTFRAERSETRRHLSEFYMVEAETVTMETGLSGIVELIESLYKYTLEKVLKRSCEDVRLYHDRVAEPEVKVRVVSSPDLIQCIYRFQYNTWRDTESNPHWGWFWVWDRD